MLPPSPGPVGVTERVRAEIEPRSDKAGASYLRLEGTSWEEVEEGFPWLVKSLMWRILFQWKYQKIIAW